MKRKAPKIDAAALRELAERLGDAKVQTRLALLTRDPAAYAGRYRQELEDRNVEDAPIDPWLQLVDALVDADLACGIDWKFAAEDVEGNLRRVAKKKRLPVKALFAFYDEDAHLMTKTLDFITFAGRALSAHQIALVELAIESDSYELTLVPWKEVPALQKLAKRLGGAVVLHGPKTPLGAPMKSVPPKKIPKLVSVRVADLDGKGFVDVGVGVLASTSKETTLVDCRVWPPKKESLGVKRGHVVVRAVTATRAEARVVAQVWHPIVAGAFAPRPTGALRVEIGRRSVDILARLPDHFDPQGYGFVGDWLVVLPTEPTIREGTTKRPLVWDGKTLKPAKGLPDARPAKATKRDPFPSFLRQGFARLGDEDVLVWEGHVWLAKGGGFVGAGAIHDPSGYPFFHGTPHARSFFYATRGPKRTTVLREVSHDGKKLVDRVRARSVWLFEEAKTSHDGAYVAMVNRYGKTKAPALVVFHPETDTWTEVPAIAFGLRKDDNLTAFGFGVANGARYVWGLDDVTLKRLPCTVLG